MTKIKLPKGSPTNGGIAGSGIFGFFGNTTICTGSDNSFYCNTMKAFNLFIIMFIFIYILYFLYSMVKK